MFYYTTAFDDNTRVQSQIISFVQIVWNLELY